MNHLIAHRGASYQAPENTLAAFKLAIDKGFDFIECDIQFSKDHQPYLFHDDRLNRTSNGDGLFKDHLAADIEKLDAGSWKSNQYKNEKVPDLESVARFLKSHPHCQMNWEFKKDQRYFSNDYLKAIAEMVSRHQLQKRLVFSSFDHELIALFYDQYPDFRYAGLVDNNFVLSFYQNANFTVEALHMSHEYFLDIFSQDKQAKDFPEIRIYTVNDSALLEQCKALGAQRFFTDKLEN
ncbi:MAG TPA: glycerophosphodiester phosphodiesterase family protein [Oligoflexia bacterium]|nr:glycerophosphodiester phosphodiesterase family protein [Oligoflexia bacterium]HMR24839.1 glycerophosphodiester phosphodiesterase family protein [Oligoflexia bacterium]